jgi:hypothetical protein
LKVISSGRAWSSELKASAVFTGVLKTVNTGNCKWEKIPEKAVPDLNFENVLWDFYFSRQFLGVVVCCQIFKSRIKSKKMARK